MLTTHYVPGAPNWIDLGSHDLEDTIAFYNCLFGWEFQRAGSDSGGYGFFRLHGKTVAAAGPLMGEGVCPGWTLYFHTSDADATTTAVERAGGVVRFPPFNVFTKGRMAGFTDPGGARFAIWQPGDTRGLDLVGEPGSLGWTELYVPDPDAVRPFYHSVFGWKIEDVPFGDMTYTLASTAEGEDAAMGGLMPLPPGDNLPHWLPFLEVIGTDAVVAKAQKQGGRTLLPATDIGGAGRFAILADPHGARFAVITSTSA